MSKTPSPSANVSIGRIGISGVSGACAKAIGPAIEKALAAATAEGRIAAGHRPRVKVALPHGATERDVAAALAKALERG